MDESLAANVETPANLQTTPEQAQFMHYLEALPRGSAYTKPDLAPLVQHDGSLPNYDPDHPVLGQGLHLHPNIIGSLPNDGEVQTGLITFTPEPLVEIGRTGDRLNDTYNGTFFGTLNLGTGIEGTNIAVAVKPIRLYGTDHTIHEAAMLEYAAWLGLPTLEVVGVSMDHEGAIPTGYVITRREPGLQTLNKLDIGLRRWPTPTRICTLPLRQLQPLIRTYCFLEI